MTESGTADKLVLNIGVKVDDKEYIDLKKSLEENRKTSLDIKVNPSDKLAAPQITLKPPKIDMTPPVLGDKLNKKLLNKKVKDKTDSEEEKKKKEKEKKDQGNLSKLVEFTSKSLDVLRNISDAEEYIKKKKKDPKDDSTSSGIVDIVSKVLNIGSEIQKKYIEKLDRELDLSNLAFQTNSTVDGLAKLNYQANNVGLNLEQIAHSAENFASSILSGQDSKQVQLASALGINLVQEMKGVKTLEDVEKVQHRLFEKALIPLQRGPFPFLAVKQAAELAGIPENQAYSFKALDTKKNLDLAQETKNLRGNIGDKAEVIGNYMEITSKLQNKIASLDKLFSREDIIKKLSIKSAEISAGTVNLINATLDFSGMGDPNSFFSALFGLNSNQHPRKVKMGPSPSAQVKGAAG